MKNHYLIPPDPFLNTWVHDITLKHSITGLCVGYESKKWRAKQLAEHVIEWLPEFSLTYEEAKSLHSGNARKLFKEAAQKVYTSESYKNRGEFGEILLHIAIRQIFSTIPAVSKIYFKSASNDTVKGFDCVHVSYTNETIELWLGEAKFYNNINRAINDVITELKQHLKSKYLRQEFILIRGKISLPEEIENKLKELTNTNNSLDNIIDRLCIPVLLTYDAKFIKNHNQCSSNYKNDFVEAVSSSYQVFLQKLPSELLEKITIRLFIMPLESKEELVLEMNNALKNQQ